MKQTMEQQIVISGVGGQGVLFVTRLLAEAAIAGGRSVLTAETHGMAQRGGTVLSHLKIGHWSSPMIRRGQADGILSLKAETMAAHSPFLKPSAWAVVNDTVTESMEVSDFQSSVAADAIAERIANPRAVNLIVLGAVLGRSERNPAEVPLFCTFDDIITVVQSRLHDRPQMRDQAIEALNAGRSA